MITPVFNSQCLNECLEILNSLVLPEFPLGNERPLEESDFIDVKTNFETASKLINHLLISGGKSESDNESFEISQFLVPFIIHCGENNKLSYWTTQSTLENCFSSFEFIFGTSPNKYCVTQLVESQGKLIKLILAKLRICLCSDSWKKYPTAVQCYVWILKLLPSPYVGDYLNLFLPTALIITDDFTVSNKLLGIECLQHIIDNVSLSDLQLRSYDEVIFKTLELSFLEKDACLITPLVSCLLTLLSKMYITTTDKCGKWTHYDDLLTKYIYQLKLEGNIKIKKSMIESFSQIISSCGLLSVRYITSIIEIIEEYSTFYETMIPALRVLEEILVVCSYCIELHLKQITFIILKTVNLSKKCKQKSHRDNILVKCKLLLNNVYLLKPSLLQDLLDDIQFEKLSCEIKLIINEVVSNSRR